MIITQSCVVMESQHTAEIQHRETRSLTIRHGPTSGERPEAQSQVTARPPGSSVEISQAGQSLQPSKALLPLDNTPPETPMGELKIHLLKLLIERITGREIDLLTPDELHSCETSGQTVLNDHPEPAQQPPQSVGWGMLYDFYSSHHETEQTHFQAQGVVHTEDGQEITLSLQLNMSREFISESHLQIAIGDEVMKDPLVVNFNGAAAQLTERNFNFDIDADGHEEQIAFLKPESGLLSIDRNADGIINDGAELLGALSGDGFEELSKHDDDGNGWIDEADTIYNRLRVWTKSATGQDSLLALGQVGIGAIYLGSVETPFLLKDAANETQGQVRQSGIYLSEDGQAGSLQQVDLVV